MKVDRACIRIHVYTGACTSHFPENAHVPAHTVPELLHRVLRAACQNSNGLLRIGCFQLSVANANFPFCSIAAVSDGTRGPSRARARSARGARRPGRHIAGSRRAGGEIGPGWLIPTGTVPSSPSCSFSRCAHCCDGMVRRAHVYAN